MSKNINLFYDCTKGQQIHYMVEANYMVNSEKYKEMLKSICNSKRKIKKNKSGKSDESKELLDEPAFRDILSRMQPDHDVMKMEGLTDYLKENNIPIPENPNEIICGFECMLIECVSTLCDKDYNDVEIKIKFIYDIFFKTAFELVKSYSDSAIKADIGISYEKRLQMKNGKPKKLTFVYLKSTPSGINKRQLVLISADVDDFIVNNKMVK